MATIDIAEVVRSIRAGHALLTMPTFEEDYALEVLRASAGEVKYDLLTWSITSGIQDGLVAESAPIADTTHPAGALVHLAQSRPARTVVVMLDLVPHLEDERTLRCLREAVSALARRESAIVLVDHQYELPPVVAGTAIRIDLSFPNTVELEEILRRTLREVHQKTPIETQLRREDLDAILQNLQGLTRRQAREAVIDCVAMDRRIDAEDIRSIIQFKKRVLRGVGVLDPVESPTTLDEIGGLKNLKAWLNARIGAMSDAAIEFGLETPRGVLMLGVQGAGKSLAAKAVATAWKRPLLRLEAGALFDRYIGESERKLRESLRQAEMMSPVVLWIDEIEKAFASSAAQSADGGLGRRMFGSLLTWMQEHKHPVFLIATANDISALPPELLRKGRFDEVFFVDLPNVEARRHIFEIHLRKRKHAVENFDLDEITRDSEGYSGAEIEQAVVSAMYDAFSSNTMLGTSHILAALLRSPPLSVTMAERVDELREWAKGRCAMAD